ncbi:transcriptional regulator [Planotetraspora thailandica]|uniref:Transcriptional regulator n=1 Tax=Planotetraspora thailandica TaxID=487172 RepID=A0A8J3XZN9_9ACTN|nr:MarR family transcriptional regulator [Planotetraspora thailandica]GII58121.1 transcriptional regulator [Planotetraspora thailandica]
MAEHDDRTDAGRDEEAVRDYVEQMAMTFARFGFPRMPARILFALMVSDDGALTAGELAEQLDVSPAAVSNSVRYLMQLGMLVREPVRGSRRDRYRLPEHAWYTASVSQGHIYDQIADLVLTGVKALGGPESAAGARAVEMADFLRFFHREMDGVLDRWRATRLDGASPA